MKSPTKKTVKPTSSYDKLNNIFESIVNESASTQVDEGFLDNLLGRGPTAGMTADQKREFTYFVQNFQGNLTSHIQRMINSKVIDQQVPTKNVTTYLMNTYFPSYLKSYWPLEGEINNAFKTLVTNIGTNWGKGSVKNDMQTLAGLVYNLHQVPSNKKAAPSGDGSGGTPPAGGGTPPAGGGTTPTLYQQLKKQWASLKPGEKKNFRRLVNTS